MLKTNLTMLVLAVVFAFSACSYLNALETAAKTIVDIYCKAPEHLRLANRAMIANVIAPNKIEITCTE